MKVLTQLPVESADPGTRLARIPTRRHDSPSAWPLSATAATTTSVRSAGAYLTTRWLPGKRLVVATSTWDGYRRKLDRHIVPSVGRTPVRRLRPEHLEALYDRMLHPTDGRRALAPKTVLEVHLIIRNAQRRCAKVSCRATSR